MKCREQCTFSSACLYQDKCHLVVTLFALRIYKLSAVFAEPPANAMRQC